MTSLSIGHDADGDGQHQSSIERAPLSGSSGDGDLSSGLPSM
jgi:hypothetical protein